MIIIGGGIAGLMAALRAAPAPVILLNPPRLGGQAASWLSQGGIAAALGDGDGAALHIADTLRAGAGLCDEAAVTRIIGAAPATIEMLLDYGVRFDRDANGHLAFGLEAAHCRPRILHCNGDQTGAGIMRCLVAAARATPSIKIVEATARQLLVSDGGVEGVLAATPAGPLPLRDHLVLLATGGIGGLFRHSTNPPAAIGQGLVLAAEAGALMNDLEFIQFHPTALDVPGLALPLISEAVRGEGAILVNERGHAFMNGADLAPRDVVARAVFAQQAGAHKVFLDARPLGRRFAARFPTIHGICARHGIDPAGQPIPVCAAAHYHMGGVQVDEDGATNIEGLFAAGEVARTGLHGANRLASNSLLEAAYCGARSGRAMADRALAGSHRRRRRPLPATALPAAPDAAPIRDIMSAHLGVLRDAPGLTGAIEQLSALAPGNGAAGLGLAIAQAALARRQSVGAHCRRDEVAAKAA